MFPYLFRGPYEIVSTSTLIQINLEYIIAFKVKLFLLPNPYIFILSYHFLFLLSLCVTEYGYIWLMIWILGLVLSCIDIFGNY